MYVESHKDMSNKNHKKMCIVIPIYSSKLSQDDILCINMVRKNKGRNDVIILAPNGLNIENMPVKKNEYEYFDDYYFRNADSYSRLLMKRQFYQRFQNRYV